MTWTLVESPAYFFKLTTSFQSQNQEQQESSEHTACVFFWGIWSLYSESLGKLSVLGAFVLSVRPSGAPGCTDQTHDSESVSSTWGSFRTQREQWTETPSTGATLLHSSDFTLKPNILTLFSILSWFWCGYWSACCFWRCYCPGLEKVAIWVSTVHPVLVGLQLWYLLWLRFWWWFCSWFWLLVFQLWMCFWCWFSCCRCVTGFVSLILKALQGRFVIPDFSTFTEETQKLFSRCRQLSSVQVSPTDMRSAMTSCPIISWDSGQNWGIMEVVVVGKEHSSIKPSWIHKNTI